MSASRQAASRSRAIFGPSSKAGAIQASSRSPCCSKRPSPAPASRAASISGSSARSLGRQLVVEQALADAEAGDDQPVGIEHADQRLAAAGSHWAGSGSATARPTGCRGRSPLSIFASAALRSVGPVDRHVVLVGDRQRMVGQRHFEPGERAPAAADQVEGPARRGALEAGAGDRLADLLGERGLAFLQQRVEAQHAERQRGAAADPAAARPRPARGCRRRDRRRCRRRREWRRARPAPPFCPLPRRTGCAARSRGGGPGRGRRRRSRPRAPRRWRRCGCGPPPSA